MRDRGDRYGPMEWAQSVQQLAHLDLSDLEKETVCNNGYNLCIECSDNWLAIRNGIQPAKAIIPAPPETFRDGD